MLIPNDDGTCTAGPADILYILRLPTGRYHVTFAEEYPMPGPVKPIAELPFLRFKSKFHDTEGTETLLAAQAELQRIRDKIGLADTNVVSVAAFEASDPVAVFVLANFTTGSVTLAEALGADHG